MRNEQAVTKGVRHGRDAGGRGGVPSLSAATSILMFHVKQADAGAE